MKQKVNNEQIRKSWTVTNTVSIVNTNPARNSSLPVKNPERQWVLLVVKPKTRPWRCWRMTAPLSLRRRRAARRSVLTLERRSRQPQRRRRRRARGASPIISDFHDFLLSKDQPSHFQVRPRLLQHQARAHRLLLPLWQVGFPGLVKRTTMMIDISGFSAPCTHWCWWWWRWWKPPPGCSAPRTPPRRSTTVTTTTRSLMESLSALMIAMITMMMMVDYNYRNDNDG